MKRGHLQLQSSYKSGRQSQKNFKDHKYFSSVAYLQPVISFLHCAEAHRLKYVAAVATATVQLSFTVAAMSVALVAVLLKVVVIIAAAAAVVVITYVKWQWFAGKDSEIAVLYDGSVPLISRQFPTGHREGKAFRLLFRQPRIDRVLFLQARRLLIWFRQLNGFLVG
jgi:hypothetical protein